MKITGIVGIVAAIAIIIVGLNSLFIVDQRDQALVLEFGAVKSVHNAPGQTDSGPGLKLKTPFIQNVVTLDKRNLRLDIDRSELLASDQEVLLIDAFVRWRIAEPLQFYQSLQTLEAGRTRLNSFTETALRESVAQRLPADVISGDRAALMDQVRDDLRVAVEENELGIEIIDVRIKRAERTNDVSDRIFERMIASRQQIASRIRAEGEEEAKLIEADARRQQTVILADARRDSETIRGQGDAKRNEIYADAYSEDAEFFRFQRALIACEQAYANESGSSRLRIVVSPDNLGLCDEFIRRARQNGRPSR